MRWTAVSIGEMTMIVDPRIVRHERFIADDASRYGMPLIALDNVSMSMLADMRFFTRCAKSLSCRTNHAIQSTKVIRR